MENNPPEYHENPPPSYEEATKQINKKENTLYDALIDGGYNKDEIFRISRAINRNSTPLLGFKNKNHYKGGTVFLTRRKKLYKKNFI